jgi:hypothetical protein
MVYMSGSLHHQSDLFHVSCSVRRPSDIFSSSGLHHQSLDYQNDIHHDNLKKLIDDGRRGSLQRSLGRSSEISLLNILICRCPQTEYGLNPRGGSK